MEKKKNNLGPYKSKLGITLKQMREKLGMSQKKFADKIGVSPQAVSKWENCDSNPDLNQLTTISRLFHTSIDALVTQTVEYDEFTNENLINFKLKQIYYAHKRGESISSQINDVISLIIPLETKSDFYWLCSARMILKATFYAMLEDDTVNEDKYTIQTLKDILQFANLDGSEKREKVCNYFKDKSPRCRELISVYVDNAQTTAKGILGCVTTYVNLLSY